MPQRAPSGPLALRPRPLTTARATTHTLHAPAQSAGGILLPDSGKKLNEGEVVAVGPGATAKDGKVLPMNVSVGDRVLLPEYGGHSVKIGEDECVACARPRARPRLVPWRPALTLFLPHPSSPPLCRLFLFRDEDILGKYK